MCALFFAALALASPAAAQDEIIVTLERRPQATNTIAGNAAVLTGDELERVAAQAPSEALNRLPGVAIHRNNGVENLPAIRSPVLVGNQSAGSFLVLEDGVPIRAPGFANVNQLFETSLDFASRVEVVRGPGSALYGSNAVHGIVNVITPAAGREHDSHLNDCDLTHQSDWETSSADVAIGDFGRISGQIVFLGGLRRVHGLMCEAEGGEEVTWATQTNTRYIAAISANHDDGWRDQSSLDQQTGLFGLDAELGEWDVRARLFAQNLNQESAGFIQGPRAYDTTAVARSNPAPDAYRDTQIVRAQARFSLAFGEDGDQQLAVTPYVRWIDADLSLFFFPSRAQELSEQQGGGVQLAYYWDPSDSVSLILGADADLTRGSLWEFQRLPNQPNGYLQGLHYDYEVDMTVLAAYVQARWQFAEQWRLVAGLRGETVRYEYDNHAPDGDFGRFRRPADRDDEFDALTPKLGLVWTPSENQSLWFNYARGARPPQITDLYSLQTTQTPGEQGVETLDSYELGWRGALGDARVELALYHMNKRDTSFRNADGFTVTDGRTRHQGVELSGIVPITDDLDLSAWIAYARHTYRFDDPSSRAGESIAAGDDVDSAPRWLWNARLAWRPFAAVETELEWAHMGKYFTNAANTARYDGHDVLNLRADWRAREDLSLFLAVRNLTNTDYAERADFAFGNDRYFPGEDRAVTIGLRARY